jgi:hypothetical protein
MCEKTRGAIIASFKHSHKSTASELVHLRHLSKILMHSVPEFKFYHKSLVPKCKE